MKKSTLLLSAMFAAVFANSQNLVSTTPKGRNIVLEEFTGIKCTYCPDGHKIAESINTNNPGRVVLINIHEGSYAVPSTGQPDFRTPFGTAIAQMCKVTGYPMGTVNRNLFPGATGLGLGRDKWVAGANVILTSGNSPVNVGISSVYDSVASELNITVELYYTGDGAGTNKLNVVLLENNVIGPQTGGGTSYNHKHILRDMITGQWGEDITTTTTGTKVTKTYKYAFDKVKYKINNCDIAAFVTKSDNQTTYTGEQVIANGGITIAPNGQFTMPSTTVQNTAASVKSSFTFNTKNNGTAAEDFKFELTSSAPAGWVADFDVNGTNYTGTSTVNLAAGADVATKINITPNTTVGVGMYTLTMTSVTFPKAPPVTTVVYVISGVTDLIISSSSKDGNGTADATKFEGVFKTALAAANNTSYAATTSIFAESAMKDNALAGVKNIYYNVGWTFPTFANDNIVAQLTSFINAGGNVFISGQDIAWDLLSGIAQTNGTAAQKTFFTTFFNAKFYNDGSTKKNTASINSGDFVFGNLNTGGNITINDYYGGGALFPDVLGVVGNGQAILYHAGVADSVCGIRTQGTNYRTVYVSFGMEQVSATVANAIVGRAHDWFYGYVSTNDFDKAMLNLSLGQNYPNPSVDRTTIPVNNIENTMSIQVLDLTGRVISQQTVNKGANSININTADLKSGLYMYRLVDSNNAFSKAMPMQVIH